MKINELKFLELSDVEFDAEGLPKSWKLLVAGSNRLTHQGRLVDLELSGEDLAQMADYQRQKGAKIPIDCQHVISNLAGKIGVDESEIVRRLPRAGGVAGFGNLTVKNGALYLSEVEFLPIAQGMMREGQFRYFSPALRGLDGKSPLRLTSVVLTNEPCLQGISSLAASEESDAVTPETVLAEQQKLIKSKEDKIMDPNEKTKSGDGGETEVLAILREVLGDNVTPENLRATLAALKTNADALPGMQARLEALECAEESRKLEAVRKEGLAKGKLTPVMLQRDYFKKMGSIELSEYCAAVPDGCAAPMGVLELGERKTATSRTAAKTQTYNSVAEAIDAATVTEMK